jgi:hypothetical protein
MFPERAGHTVRYLDSASGGCPVNRLLWLRRPAKAWALAALVLALGLALIPLSIAARQNPLATAGPQIAIAVPFAAVGLVIAGTGQETRSAGSCSAWPRA